jgi:hypothetical protein
MNSPKESTAMSDVVENSLACQGRDRPHKETFQLEAFVAVLAGFAGFFSGLYLLGTDPIAGVLVMLGSMALLLRSVASLCGVQSVPCEADNDAAEQEL